jgi:hypothetical protein
MVVQGDPLPLQLSIGPCLLYILSIVLFNLISVTKSIVKPFIIFKESVSIIQVWPSKGLYLLKGGPVLLLCLEVGLLLD